MNRKKMMSVAYVMILFVGVSFCACRSEVLDLDNGIVYSRIDGETQSVDKIAVTFLSPSIVKVSLAASDSLLNIPSLIAKDDLSTPVHFSWTKNGHLLELRSDSLLVCLDRSSGEITFFDHRGGKLLEALDYELALSDDQRNYRIKQNFFWEEGEALYGLGQHKIDQLDLRGQQIELSQHNTRVSIPVLLSSKGYGLYWDNYSQSYYNDVNDSSYFASDVADKIQYYFVKGNNFDRIIGGLRELTGESPMLPRWAFGFFQSRNRYKNRTELMEVVKKHRALNIPLDAIILDYMHWGDKGFGSMVFDPTDFPEAEQMIDELHTKFNCKIITSVWPSFNRNRPNWELFAKDSLLLGLHLNSLFGDVYDAYNPQAGSLYWSLVKRSYWDKGVDGIWFDATEPEQIDKFRKTQCYLGATAKYQNLFSYFDMKNVFEPQLEVDTNRVYVLTRSAFLGQQKFGAVVWSGDIEANFKALREQIPTGLNFCMAGLPYWNTDIGGYLGGDPNDEEYQEVFLRWFQYGAFTPMFRSHGRRQPMATRSGHNEVWSYGAKNQQALTQAINLRYRLLPYIYTLSSRVSTEGYTMMRALVFDFLSDKKVYNITDQFLVGDIMVCPVTVAKARKRAVYLPEGCDWFDFWTGKKYKGGQDILASAPIDKIPLFVKAGTILPLADVMQYSSEKKLENLEIRIYPGQDASFDLYEDEGDNYNYTKGKSSKLHFSYKEQENSFTIGAPEGTYKGMLKNRQFQISKVSEGVAIGITKPMAMQTVNYRGTKDSVQLVK